MSDLKPCPFCGGKAELKVDGDNGHFIACDDCDASSTIFRARKEDVRQDVFEAWNARVQAPAPVAAPVQVKALEWDNEVMPPFSRFARSPIGTYRVQIGHTPGSGWWCYFAGMMGKEGHASEEGAMAEAQADYEQRIRSALISGDTSNG